MAYSRYYRYKLSNLQKKLYDKLLSGMEERKHEIRHNGMDAKDIHMVLHALNMDNPSLYYVDFSCIKILKSAFSCSFIISYNCDLKTQQLYDRTIKDTVCSVQKIVRGQREEAIPLIVHDWLVSNCKYGDCNLFPNAAHSIVGALCYSKCVCEGYAKALKHIADSLKIRCIVVTGKGIHPNGTEGEHAWNIIKVKNRFYHIDVTFDLLIADQFCSRAYYLLSTKEILYDHKLDDSIEFPICESSGSILKVVNGTSELISFLKTEYQRGVTHSEVRLSKGFTGEELVAMIRQRLSAKDIKWYNHIRAYWYGDYCRTLFVCWR